MECLKVLQLASVAAFGRNCSSPRFAYDCQGISRVDSEPRLAGELRPPFGL